MALLISSKFNQARVSWLNRNWCGAIKDIKSKKA